MGRTEKKQKVFILILIAEAVLCLVFFGAEESPAGIFSATMAFPFELIGQLLRRLSLSGAAGNLIAIFLYLALSLMPVWYLVSRLSERKLCWEDILLGLMSMVLFGVLYLMINPGLMSGWLNDMLVGESGEAMGKAMLGGVVYSILFGYVVLRILRQAFSADTARLRGYLVILLYLLSMIFVFAAFGSCFDGLMTAMDELRAANVGSENGLGQTYLFLVLGYLVDALPYVLDVALVFGGLRLLKELEIDHYSEASVTAAKNLSRRCRIVLTVTVCANMGFNLLQLFFAHSLRNISGSVEFPFLSVIFVLLVLLLVRLIQEGKQLKDDNDSFI